MSIELDWQMVEEDVPPDQPVRPPAPRPRRRLPRKWLIAFVVILVAAIAVAAGYVGLTYRRQLDRAEREVRPVAKLEAQATAANDPQSFLALQDPEDPDWRAAQEKRFGRLEHVGLPEFGWKAMGVAPQPGPVSLEPGGARLDVTYQFSVTQPMLDGPAVVKLRLPQYYKQTPSGWVRANPGVEYWGGWRTRSGKYFAMRYTQRDADVLDPLIARMDEMLARVCDALPCPPQPIYIAFENSPEALAGLTDFSYGFEYYGSFVLHLPSPQLFGVPADARSRDELYRAIGTRIVQALVTEASARQLSASYLSSQGILQWGLAQAGLAGPLITPEISRTLAFTLQLGLPTLSVIPRWTQSSEVMLPLALSFIEQAYGPGHAVRLLPAMGRGETVGQALSTTFGDNPTTLEPAWQNYLRRLVGLPAVSTPPPPGELWLGCSDQTAYSIWRVRTDGSELTRVITLTYGPAWLFAWSRDGQRLAYVGSASVSVIDADGRLIKTYRPGLIGWLPGGRLWIIDAFSDDREKKSRVLNLDTGEDDEITGTYPVWSPDGTRVAYFVQDPSDATVWVADADGRNARALGSGYMATWSPDSRRIAFLSGLDTDPAEPMGQTLGASKVEIADVASGDVTTFARRSDVLRSLGQDDRQWTMGDVSWSPDGSRIAVSIGRTGARALAEPNFLLAVLDAATGAVRAQWRGEGMGIPTSWLSQRTWSPDGRYLVFAIPTDGTSGSFGDLNILDTDTGKTITVPGIGLWDWSPADGRKWLAIPQPGQGLLLLTLDLSAIHRLTNVPNCFSVAWRPGER